MNEFKEQEMLLRRAETDRYAYYEAEGKKAYLKSLIKFFAETLLGITFVILMYVLMFLIAS